MDYITIVSNAAITVLAVVALALRLEHRLTRIETDISWMKKKLNNPNKGVNDNGSDCKMDQA